MNQSDLVEFDSEGHLITPTDRDAPGRCWMVTDDGVRYVDCVYVSEAQAGSTVNDYTQVRSSIPEFGERRSGWVGRHAVTIVIVLICALGLISSAYPPLTRVLNVCLLIAVIVAAVVFVTVFGYLIGTSVRSALRFRRGEQ